MRESSFVGHRSERWKRLGELVSDVERGGLSHLDGEQITELARLYRSATTDLAVARGRGYRTEVVDALNRAVARAHAIVYMGNASNGWQRVRDFFGMALPAELRRSSPLIGICAALFILAAVFAFTVVIGDPHAEYSLLPDQMIPGAIKKSLHDTNFAVSGAFSPALSAFVITNNIRVAIVEFAGGMTGGLLTLYFLIFNGIYLGATAAAFSLAGFGYDFYATVAPHGAVELPSIIIAAAAGLIIGKSLILPGRVRRIDALREAAKRAAILLIGVAALLVWAGIFEGFVSPRRIAPELRIGIGAFNFFLLLAYWALAGKASAVTIDSKT